MHDTPAFKSPLPIMFFMQVSPGDKSVLTTEMTLVKAMSWSSLTCGSFSFSNHG